MRQLALFLFGLSLAFLSCNNIMPDDKDQSDNLVDSAEVMIKHNKWRMAESFLIRAIALNNKNAIAYNDLAGCKFNENKPLDTVAYYYDKAKKNDPGYIIPYLNLADCYAKNKLWERSIMESRKCIDRIDTTDENTKIYLADVYEISGRSYFKLKKYDSALVHLVKCIELDKTNDRAYSYLCSIMLRGGKYEKCIDLASIPINRGTSFYDIFNIRGACYTKIGKYSLALRDMDIAIEKVPDCADYYANRYVLFTKMKMMDKAMRDYKMADSLGDEETKEFIRKKME